MSDYEPTAPARLTCQPEFWRSVAAHLRLPQGGRPLRAGCQELLEAVECDWRADLLERVWADAAAWSIMADCRAQGMSFDVALMVAVPDAT